jgi:hypothetical protein
MEPNKILTRIESAKTHVEKAEEELEQLLAEIRAEPRAHKVSVSEILQHAFVKLRSAQHDVLELEKLVKGG